ncbi:MAG: hypothetical protein IIW76_03670 [Bacteroidales bacterium]|nr:hypothetical protein [Bacteroidales bacterium]
MLYLCKLRIEQKNIMEKEQSNNQQPNNNSQQLNNIQIPDYYIQQSRPSHLKESVCVVLNQQDKLPYKKYDGCLCVNNFDTAKAITCFLRNIDINDSPQTLVLRLANIVSNLNNANNTNSYYQIPYKNNGLKDKAVNSSI